MNFGVNPVEWRGLLNSANAGELTLHPEIGKGLDKVCDDYLDKLDGILESAAYVRRVSGFGTLPSGQALEEKFSLKATGTAQSLDAVLMQHIDAVKIAKEVVAKAIANFVELDQSRADQFTGLDATP
ncbi:hypothetical protein ACW9HR_00910 [Nocardia gipuzkoensis]|uniref:hypothetical protein n=1 Tax=Nocardia abscessus TaxID=120957 RepID=UPI001893392D|nr:hypothetical protein [Nocardia abscessus]MBF6216673.1 hypothetical protein [Nocardia abscessus]